MNVTTNNYHSYIESNGKPSIMPVTPPVIFLDRDGVINEDSSEFIKTREEFHFIPGSVEAIKRLTQNGFSCIVITNQSMIHRKISTLSHLMDMNQWMISHVQANGGHIHDIFFCPHGPDSGCECRKPKTGLIEKAASVYSIDISQTIMVGDNLKDLQCSNRAGCAYTVLVRTGKGKKTESLINNTVTVDFIGDCLLDTVQWIIHKKGHNIKGENSRSIRF
jgi:D-glycero-D-manno-heptose 1,7-bisphosphate phosphatase